MALITQHDFKSEVGQKKIVRTLHHLEAKVHELEKRIDGLAREDTFFERDLKGPEAY